MPLSPLVKSSLLWFTAACCWVFGYMYPNQHNIPIFITNLWKGVMILIVNYGISIKNSINLNILQRQTFIWCLLRTMFYIIACTLFGVSFFYVPMPVAFSINNFSPLVVMLLDYFIYKTKISKRQIFAGLIGFIGITILTLNSSPSQQTKFQNYHNSQLIYIILAVIGLFLNVIFGAMAILLTKKIKNTSPVTISFQIGVSYLLSSSIFYQIFLQQSSSISISTFFYGLLITGSIFALSNYCQLAAIQGHQQSGVVVLAEFSVLGLAYVMSVFRYDEPINYWCVLGTVLTMVSGYLVITSGDKKQYQNQQLSYQLQNTHKQTKQTE